jgi:hypothetical protein
MKVSTENDNNFGYEKITIVVDNIPLKLVLEKLLKILEKSLKSHGIFSQERCMNPVGFIIKLPS